MSRTMLQNKVVKHQGNIIGWISKDACENATCLAAMRAGRHYHATPAGFAVTLRTYHYATIREAVQALTQRASTSPSRTDVLRSKVPAITRRYRFAVEWMAANMDIPESITEAAKDISVMLIADTFQYRAVKVARDVIQAQR